MALQSRKEELLAAWRALDSDQWRKGWRTIAVAKGGHCHLLAGRHFPGNEEALLIGFTSIRVPPAESLPKGRGFVVTKADLGGDVADYTWIALCKQDVGNLGLFVMMTDDVISTLNNFEGKQEEKVFNAFLSRIRAWQDFMRHDGNNILGPDAEIGLFGELEILRDIILSGMTISVAVESWQGPLRGVQDFSLKAGAIEVKTTALSSGFIASIGSLEQLDNTLIRPLYLAGVRLTQTVEGRTLSEQINDLRNLIYEDTFALGEFNSRLLYAGFLDAVADQYHRRFLRIESRIFEVCGQFPRLTRENVMSQIRNVNYEIDLDLISNEGEEICQVLKHLGMIESWN